MLLESLKVLVSLLLWVKRVETTANPFSQKKGVRLEAKGDISLAGNRMKRNRPDEVPPSSSKPAS